MSALSDDAFITNVFQKLNDGQKLCTILIDEVYVKPMLTYHGGQLFGRSIKDETSLAKTVLAFMISCFYGGPTFFVTMLPVNKLNSDFVYDQTKLICEKLSKVGGTVKTIITDNNRVNQAFFKKFECTSPWLTNSGIFLLFDFVHILKSIGNNWIIEKTGEIQFTYRGDEYTAKWCHIQKLQRLEEGSLVKMSKTNICGC